MTRPRCASPCASGPVAVRFLYDGYNGRAFRVALPRSADFQSFSLRQHSLINVNAVTRAVEVNARAALVSRNRQAPPKGQLKVKYAKSAAVVAGSVMALGVAAPAFAAQPGAPTMSLNGGLNDALSSKAGRPPAHATGQHGQDRAGQDRVDHPEEAAPWRYRSDQEAPLLGGLPLT